MVYTYEMDGGSLRGFKSTLEQYGIDRSLMNIVNRCSLKLGDVDCDI